MDVNGLPKTVIRQRRGCDLNPGPSAPESSTLTARLPSLPATDTRRPRKSVTIDQLRDKYKVKEIGDMPGH